MAERQIGAFATEAEWRIEGTVPKLQSYLRTGQRSIGVEWTAASLIALDAMASVPAPTSLLSKAIDAIARSIRMANDLHDPERERKEGKVQWVLLRSRELVALKRLDAQRAEAAAALELNALAAGEAALARSILRGSGQHHLRVSPALRAGLQGLLGIGLATYVPELAVA
jgi:Terpene synthase family 2, C-terminal metal binding